MKKPKNILSLFLALAFVFFSAACGTSSTDSADGDVDIEADVDVAAEDGEAATETDQMDDELMLDEDEQMAVEDATAATSDIADSNVQDMAAMEAGDPESPGMDTGLDSVPDPAAPAGDTMADSYGGSGSYQAVGSGEFENYVIAKGDTLMKIAFKVYGDITRWREIYSQNQGKIPNPNILVTGTEISYERPSVPFSRDTSGRSYLIQQGDTLGSIALDIYARVSKWRKIWNRNKDLIRDPNKIYAGFLLYYDITPEELAEAESRRGGMNQQAQQQMGDQGQPEFVDNSAEPPPMEEPAPPPEMTEPPQAVNDMNAGAPPEEDEFGEIRLPAAE